MQNVFFCLLCGLTLSIEAKTIKKAEAKLLKPLEELKPWQGKEFPYAPGGQSKENVQRMQEVSNYIQKSKDSWQGKWFPYAPGEPHILKKDPDDQVDKTNKTLVHKDSWQGKWFPYAPGEPHIVKAGHERHNIKICDDGAVSKHTSVGFPLMTHHNSTFQQNLQVDYDPEDITGNFNYLCLFSNRSHFYPNMSTESLLTEHFLPSAYVPPAKCMNESITYSHQPATK